MAATPSTLTETTKKPSIILACDTVLNPDVFSLWSTVITDLRKQAGYTHFLNANHLTLEELIATTKANLQKCKDEYVTLLKTLENHVITQIDALLAEDENGLAAGYESFLTQHIEHATEVRTLAACKGLLADYKARTAGGGTPPDAEQLKAWCEKLLNASANMLEKILLESLSFFQTLQSLGMHVTPTGSKASQDRLLQAINEILMSKSEPAPDAIIAKFLSQSEAFADIMLQQQESFITHCDAPGMGMLMQRLQKEPAAIRSNYLFFYVHHIPSGTDHTPEQEELSRIVLSSCRTQSITFLPIDGTGKTAADISQNILEQVREKTRELRLPKPSQAPPRTLLFTQRPPKKFQNYLLAGDSGVGKSALLQRWKDSTFTEASEPTIGVDYLELSHPETPVRCWAPSGQRRFFTITSSYFPRTNVCLLMFDVTNRESFDNIQYWLKQLQTYSADSAFKLILVGNKCDLKDKRVVKPSEISDAIDVWNRHPENSMHIDTYAYLEISVKTGINTMLLPALIQKTQPYSERENRPAATPGTTSPA